MFVPDALPRLSLRPSPYVTVVFWTLAELPMPGSAVTLNVVAVPTWGLLEPEASVIEAIGSGSTVTVTVCVGAGVVVVVVPEVDVEPTPAVAVTLAVLFVVSVVVARPLASLGTTAGLVEPWSELKVTGTSERTFPPGSKTVAVIVEWPPLEIVDGTACNEMLPTPAAPTAILIAPVVPVVTPPESAVIVATPDSVPALNVTITRPPGSVSASIG
jgi:hypothetical protein